MMHQSFPTDIGEHEDKFVNVLISLLTFGPIATNANINQKIKKNIMENVDNFYNYVICNNRVLKTIYQVCSFAFI